MVTEALFIKHRKYHDNTVSQKENDNFSATEDKDMDCYNQTDKEFHITVMRKSMSHKKTQKGNTVISGVILMNRTSTLSKRLKLSKKKKKSQTEILELKNSIKEMMGVLEMKQVIWKREN